MDIKEIKNVFVPYDSPIDAIFQSTIDNMASAFAKSVDDGVMTAVVKAGFHIDKNKMEQALSQDKCRYEAAYRRGYTDGYTKREDEIIRCRDCEWRGNKKKCILAFVADKQEFPLFFYDQRGEWYCADGKPKGGDGDAD